MLADGGRLTALVISGIVEGGWAAGGGRVAMTIKEQFFRLVEGEWDNLRQRYGVRRIGLFGSCLREEATEDSDVDVLVEFDEVTFDNYMDVKFFLEDHLGRGVDLVIAESIKPRLRDRILSEVEYVEGR